MSKTIFAAIEKLQVELITINRGTALPTRTEALNKELPALLFVNPKFWPDSIQPPQTVTMKEYDEDAKKNIEKQKMLATQEQMDEYSNQVLQAVFNITNVSGGYRSAITNSTTISQSFNALDSTWVPQIFDDRTYQVGLALQRFLTTALSEQALSELPEKIPVVGKVRKPAESLLRSLKITLDWRIKIYELHSNPEEVFENARFYQMKMQQWHIWDSSIRSLEKKFKEDEQLFFKAMPIIREVPPSGTIELEEHLKKLEALRMELVQKLSEFDEATQNFADFNEKWKKENDEMNLPEEIRSTPITRALAARDSDQKSALIIKETSREFAGQIDLDVEVYTSKIGLDLEKTYKSGVSHANKLKAECYISSLLPEKGLLSVCIENVKLLKHHIDNDKALWPDTISKPPCVTGEFPEISLDVVLSTDADNSVKLTANRDAYDKALKELNDYHDKLVKGKEKLASTDLNDALPAWPEEFPYQDIFKKARSEKQKQLLTEMESQINAVNKLIQTATLEKSRINRELIKFNRDGATKQASSRIQETFQKKADSKKHSSHVNYDYHRTQVRYERALSSKEAHKSQLTEIASKISTTQQAIKQETDSIKQLQIKRKHRELFLLKAKEKLTQFKKDLSEHKGFYIPADKIPQAELIKYLECGSNEFYDNLYLRAQNGNAYYGANLTYGIDWASYLLGLKQYESDFQKVSKDIEDKIELIDKELKIKLEGQDEQPGSESIAEENLWSLQKSYQKATHQKNAGGIQLGLLKTQQEQLQKEQEETNELLDILNKGKSELEQKVKQADLTMQHDEFSNQQAVLASDMLKLEYELADIGESVANFDQLFQNLAHLAKEELLAQSADLEEQLNTIGRPLTERKTYWEKSVAELIKQVQETINSLEKKWKQVPPSPELASEFQDLKKQLTASLEDKGIENTYATLSIKIAEKQNTLLQLKELAVTQIKSTELLQKASLLEHMSPDERGELYEQIKHFENEIEPQLTVIMENSNELVKKKVEATKEMLQGLTQVKNSIEDLEHLPKINFVYAELDRRVDACEPNMVLARRKLLKEIELFEQSDLGISLTRILINNNPAVKKEREPVLQMHYKIGYFKMLYKPSPKEGCDLHLLDDLPTKEEFDNDKLGTYKKCYIYSKEASQLYYISYGKSEPVKINDPDLFQENLEMIKKQRNTDPLKLTGEEIYTLITLNGGHSLPTLFADLEAQEDQKDKDSILEHLDHVIAGYEGFKEREKKLSPNAAQARQKLFSDIKEFEESELVTLLNYISERETREPEIQAKIERLEELKAKLNTFKMAYDELGTKQAINEAIEKATKSTEQFGQARAELKTRYFGEESIFDNYLKERKSTFAFRDFFSSAAALVLGCFGYKTESQKREEYLEELQAALQAYQKAPINDVEEVNSTHSQLREKIDIGLKNFSPRSKEGEDHGKSLNAKLTAFRTDVENVHSQIPKKQEELDYSVSYA
ncbi:hypothetical protein [Fluoribacter gormanii]|uniref:Uncharacterized protein n=1 Tax=Fluoribacter gormanii TaxID=464 RepID=A0A377GFR4_9GAMM|nr:hypothetical protein [Fluoribacter gormanii]KTD00476.1 hypothetical protein Lgor_2952 [Fluoribacter gormanii]SIR09633.1 hypothetical protein SAMN05421777_106107 [Fluoribacter gormanii]STO23222.1 Uncharacterised protein [Fluoribacter gormanii]